VGVESRDVISSTAGAGVSEMLMKFTDLKNKRLMKFLEVGKKKLMMEK
jgi:hypothetical protein